MSEPKLLTAPPDEWPRKRLDEVCSVVSRGKQPTYVEQSPVRAINQKCVRPDGFQVDPTRYQDPGELDKHLTTLPGDVLLNSTGRGTIGRSCVLREDGEFIVDSHVTLLRPVEGVLDPSYLDALLRSWMGQNYLETHCYSGSTSQVELSKTALVKSEIPVPPFAEQRRIADVLDTVDAAIQETDAVVEKQEQVKTGLLQDLLTRGLDANGRLRDPKRAPEAFRETELGRLPKQWAVRRFEDLIAEGPQNGLYKPKSAYTDGEQGFPIVRIDSFYGGKLTAKDDLRRLELTESERKKYGLEPGDILINRVNSRGFIGKNAIVPPMDEPTVFESNVMRIKVDESKILPKYLNGLMNTPIVLRQLQRRAKDAVAQSSINQQDVKGCLIPVPDLEEQSLVVDRIETEEDVIDEERAYMAKLQSLKTGLMQDLLTGRMRVPEAEARVNEVVA